MQTKRIVCVACAAALGFGSLSAFAQGYDRHDGNWQGQRHEERAMGNRDHGHDRGYDHGHDRGYDRTYDRHDRRDEGHDRFYYGARGPEWHRGGRIPPEYRNRQYVVDDWRAHHLAPPPRGYHWVQVGNDYVLAAIATGIIAQLLLNNQY